MPAKPPLPKNTRPPLTHFLSIPLSTPLSRPHLQKSLQALRTRIRSKQPPFGVDGPASSLSEDAVRPVGSIHLTLGVMSLRTRERVESAVRFLEGLDVGELIKVGCTGESAGGDGGIQNGNGAGVGADGNKYLGKMKLKLKTKSHREEDENSLAKGENVQLTTLEAEMRAARLSPGQNQESEQPQPQPQPHPHPQSQLQQQQKQRQQHQPITISLHSLHSLRSPTSTTNLYAHPSDPTSRLLALCHALHSRFTAAGFLVPEDRELKLHATIINTVYTSRGARSGGKRAKPLAIDARRVMEMFDGVVWAQEIVIEKVAICRMGTEKVVVEGEVVDEVYGEEGARMLDFNVRGT